MTDSSDDESRIEDGSNGHPNGHPVEVHSEVPSA